MTAERNAMVAGLVEDTRLLSLDEVMEKCGISKPTVYNYIRNRNFPHSIRIGKAVGWSEPAVNAWLRAQLQPDPPGGPNTEAADAPSDQPEPTA